MIVFIILFLLYINPPIYINAVYVSGLAFFLVLFPSFIVSYKLISVKISKYLFSLFVFLLLSIFIVSDPLLERIMSLGQLCLGIFSFTLAIRYFTKSKNSTDVLKLYLCFILFIIIGCFSEVYLGMDMVSDSVRFYLFSDTGFLYESDFRDVEKTGFIRPKLFTSEPSHVIKMYMALSIGIAHFINSKLRLLVWLMSAGILFYLFHSLSILAVAFVIVLYHFFKRYRFAVKSFPYLFLLVIAVLVLIFNESYGTWGIDLFFATSENIRVFYPLMTLADVLKENPMFGVGVGDKGQLLELSRITPYIENQLLIDKKVSIGNNALLRHFMYFGAVGGVLFFWLFRGLLRVLLCDRNNVHFIMFSIFVFLTQIGSIVSLQTWFYLAIICVPYAILDNRQYIRVSK